MKLKGHPKSTPLDSNNILLRGSTLRNTKWVLAVVIFTGKDTKLMMNSRSAPHKRSNVERKVNRYLAIVFTLLFITAILSTAISSAISFTQEERV